MDHARADVLRVTLLFVTLLIYAFINVCLQQRERIMNQLKEAQNAREQKRKAKEDLQNKLQQMQGKLLVGGVNLLDEYQIKEQQLRLQQQELEQKAVRCT